VCPPSERAALLARLNAPAAVLSGFVDARCGELNSLAEQARHVGGLLRVAREARIFPLLTLGGEESPLVGPVADHLTRRAVRVEVAPVPYEFQRGGNRMLRLTRA
jgi:hypothetical protein